MIPKPRYEFHGTRAATLALGFMALLALDLQAAIEFAPAFVLAFVLSLGFRPGERLVERIHAYQERRRKKPTVPEPAPRVKPRQTIGLIGRIAASSLAMRPPPQLLPY